MLRHAQKVIQRVAMPNQLRVGETLNLPQPLLDARQISHARGIDISDDLRHAQRQLPLLPRFALGDDLSHFAQDLGI